MKRLRRILGHRPATLLCYMSLWDAAGERAGRVKISYRELGADVGVSPRTASGHVEKLVDVGLVEIVDHQKPSGELILYVSDHVELGAPRRVEASPQTELFDVAAGDDGEAESDAADAGERPTTSKAISLAIDSPRAPAVVAIGDDGPRKPPTGVEGDGSGVLARKPPSYRDNPRAPAILTGVCAPKPPPPPMETIERKDISTRNHTPIEQSGSHGNHGDAAGVCAPKPPRGSADHAAADLAAGDLAADFGPLERRREAERAKFHRDDPKPIDSTICRAMLRLADVAAAAEHPLEQKARLMRVVRARLADEATDDVVVARVAEYVLEDGFPLDELEKLFDELDRAAAAGKIRTTRGAWFGGALNRRLAARGIRPRRRRTWQRAP
jgi:DNA-binding transcriptional ArsR family regulator